MLLVLFIMSNFQSRNTHEKKNVLCNYPFFTLSAVYCKCLLCYHKQKILCTNISMKAKAHTTTYFFSALNHHRTTIEEPKHFFAVCCCFEIDSIFMIDSNKWKHRWTTSTSMKRRRMSKPFEEKKRSDTYMSMCPLFSSIFISNILWRS